MLISGPIDILAALSDGQPPGAWIETWRTSRDDLGLSYPDHH